MSNGTSVAKAETREGDSHLPERGAQKNLIEQAYQTGEKLGIAVYTEDEAGVFQTVPTPGSSWQIERQPQQQPHEYIRNGTAKLLTLFHQADNFLVNEQSLVNPISYTALNEAVFCKPWVKNYQVTPLGRELFQNVILGQH